MEYELSEIKLENELTLDLELDILKIEPKLGEKNIVENGEYIPQDEGLDGYSKVNVNVPIPKLEESQRIEIVENGNYNVTPSSGYDAIEKVEINVNVPEPKLGTKTITENGTYKASDDNLDGYSEVEVATSGVDINEYMSNIIGSGDNSGNIGWIHLIKKLKSPLTIQGTSALRMFMRFDGEQIPEIDTSNVTDMSGMFYYCENLLSIPLLNANKVTTMSGMFRNCRKITTIPQLNTSNVTSMSYMFNTCETITTIPLLDTSKVTTTEYMFQFCNNLITIPLLDTSKVTRFLYMFGNCRNLTTVPLLNCSSANSMSSMFQNDTNLTTLGGFENLGQAYLTTQSANYSPYTLSINQASKLTEQSIINVLTNLYDIATKGVKPQTVTLGATNLAKLTSEEGQAALQTATERGWNVN